MHLLHTDGLTVKTHTRIIADSVKSPRDGATDPTAIVAVEIDGVEHQCTITTQVWSYWSEVAKEDSLREWEEMTSNHDRVERTVTLCAVPSTDVIGAGVLAITQIDLRVEDGECRFFVQTVN